jgi:hypothetical protein
MHLQGCTFIKIFENTFYSLDHKSLTEDLIYVPAFTINLSFACEMFIKCLLVIEDIKYKKVHYLYALFKKLPDELKNKIKMDYKNLIIKKNMIHLSSFDQQLELHTNVFHEWRYYFDESVSTTEVDYKFLMCFSMVLRDINYSMIKQKTNIFNIY